LKQCSRKKSELKESLPGQVPRTSFLIVQEWFLVEAKTHSKRVSAN